jgi:DNA-binding NarL/FixJ family response regulator
MSTDTIRVALVEDVSELRENLGHLLRNAAGIEYVGAWPTGEAALEGIMTAQPRVVLMDIHLPGMSGVECVRRLKPRLPATEFMMLTVFEEHELVYESLVAGATGYLVKKTTPEELLRAIRELHEGGSPMSSSIARKVVAALASGPAPSSRRETDLLSIREREMLERLSTGMR